MMQKTILYANRLAQRTGVDKERLRLHLNKGLPLELDELKSIQAEIEKENDRYKKLIDQHNEGIQEPNI